MLAIKGVVSQQVENLVGNLEVKEISQLVGKKVELNITPEMLEFTRENW